MADPQEQYKIYVFSRDAVIKGTRLLVAEKRHEHFCGYLALLRANRRHAGVPAQAAEITEAFDRYFLVPDASADKPYLLPFSSRRQQLTRFNPNVAGSYAPSSIRNTLLNVVEVERAGRLTTYQLRENHASAALDRLLKGQRVPIISLTAFMYRDYGFRMEAPSVSSVTDLFRDEFGLREEVADEKAVFGTLFTDDADSFGEGDIELLDSGGGQ
ncbi:MAG: hypothetical protein MEQ84_13245 [Mesorhizobium sp.]|nr:hypothetical protein [Mesorhizobium sp.]